MWWLRMKHGSFAFARLIWYFLACKPVTVSPERQAERLEHCNRCEHLMNGACERCGCFVNLKVVFSTETCADTPPRWI